MKKSRRSGPDPEAKKEGAGSGIRKRKPQLLALEPRLMFDGAAAATAPEDTGAALSPRVFERIAEKAAAPVDRTTDATPTPAATDPSVSTEGRLAAAPADGQRREIVFVDTTVAAWQTLVGGVREGVQVVLLDPQRDAFAQIAQRLRGEHDLDAIHVVSHGSQGTLIVGGTAFDEAALASHAADLDAIARALAADGDILLYGCDVAAGTAGASFVQALSRATGADVAASTDTTGNAAAWGGDWTLESRTGEVETALFATDAALAAYEGKLATINLSGNTGWIPLMFGTSKDPQGDSQAQASDTDIVADATHASLYTAYDDNGTASTADDKLVFRVRIDNPTSSTTFAGVVVVGIDANLDGKIDVFLSVDGRGSAQVIQIMDPGTGENISPSTTTTTPLPTGWLPNNGVYPMSASNYSVVPVSASTDPTWNGDTDLGNDGKTDVFVSFSVPMTDIAAVLAQPSPVDRNGVYGPRGATGIQGFGKDTTVRYISFTQTQPGTINADINGVPRDYDKNATWDQLLGPMTPPMTPGNPVSVMDYATINDPVDANGLLNATEDDAFVLTGKATASGWVRVTVTDSAASTSTYWVQANASGAWTLPAQDLSGRAQGTLTFASALVTGSGSNTVVTGSAGDTATAVHDSIGPALAINPVATAGTPTITGTSSDVPIGSTLTVTVDPNGDGVLTDAVTYSVVVGTGGAWSVNTAAQPPASGTVPSAGFTSYAKVTATAQDAAGNSTTAAAMVRPTVNTLVTNDTTPTLTGSWGGSNGGTDSLAVTVNGTTYTTAGALVVSGTGWSLTLPGALPAPATSTSYEVQATTTRSTGGTASDASTSELTLVNGPSVDITSAGGGATATIYTKWPTISGTTTSGSTVVVRIDPNNDGNYADAIYYSVAAAGSTWTLDTATALPSSGGFPTAGFSGTIAIEATAVDSQNRVAVDTQVLTVVVPTVAITSISGAYNGGAGYGSDNTLNASESGAVTVTGTSNAIGQAITVVVSDGRSATNPVSVSAVVQADGTWTANVGSVTGQQDGSLTVRASLSTASDSRGISKDSTAWIVVTSPDEQKKTNPVLSGTTDLAAGTVINITDDRHATLVPASVTVVAGTNGGPNTWSVTITSPNNLTDNVVHTFTFTPVGGVDAYGNTATAVQQQVFVPNGGAGTLPTVAITDVTGAISSVAADPATAKDGVMSYAEVSGGITIRGTSAQASIVLTVTDGTVAGTPVNGVSVAVTSGAWSYTLTAGQVASMQNGPIQIQARSSIGTIDAVAQARPVLDWQDVTPTIGINAPVGDGDLSLTEANGTVTVTGSTSNVTVGQAVTVTITNGTTTRTVATTVTGTTASGGWTASFSGANALSNFADGTLTVTATTGALSASTTLRLDKVGPAISITAGATPASSTPLVTGTSNLAVGDPLLVAIDANNDGVTDVTYRTSALTGGAWSLDTATATPLSGSLGAGLTSASRITVSASDSAGNTSSVVGSTVAAIGTDTGVSSTDFVTRDDTLVFSGYAAPSSTVQVYLDGVLVGTTTAAAVTGAWTFDHSGTVVSSATHTLRVVSTQGATPALSSVATQNFTVDTTPPAVAITAIAADSGASGSDGITNDGTLVYSGTADIGSAVTVALADSTGATVFSVVVVAADDGTGVGRWSVDRSGSALADGSYTLGATVSDSAGNTASVSRTVVVDTAASITITTNAKTSDLTPEIGGTTDLEAGRTVSVTISGATYAAVVDAAGNWSVDLGSATPASGTLVPLADGNTYTITVSGSDTAGNAATASKSLLVDLAAPVLSVTQPIGDGDLNAAEDDSVVLQGGTLNVPSGATVSVTITDGTTTINDTATVTAAGASGSWVLAPLNLSALDNGVLTVTVTYVDSTGIRYSDTGTVVHNKGGAVSIDGIGTDTAVLGDFITSDNTLVFRGSASANAVVSLTLTGPSGTVFSGVNVTANAAGAWTYDFSGTTLANGNYTLQAVGGTTVTQAIVVDNLAPAGPVTVNALTTSDTTPTLTGTATVGAGETLYVTVNGITYEEGDGHLARSGTNWSLAIPVSDALAPATVSGGFNGVYNVVATVRDAAGNATSDATTGELRVQDAVRPAIDLAPANAGSTAWTATFSGTAVSLDDDANAATLVEASDLVGSLTIAVAGVLDGTDEKVLFGSTVANADGSSGTQSNIAVGGVQVNVTYAGGVFTIQRADFDKLTQAQAEAVLRDLRYRNDLAAYSSGTRTFTFTATDDAGNVSDAAVASVNVQDLTAPVVDLDTATAGSGFTVTSNDGAAVGLDSAAAAATVTEASNRIDWIRITPSGVANGASEQLLVGGTPVPLDGSVASVAATAGGVGVTITAAAGSFTIARSDGADFTAAEAAAVLRDLDYRNTAASYTPGARSFAIQLRDDALNLSTAATATVNVVDATAPAFAAGQSFSYAENQAANAVLGTVVASDAVGVTAFRFANGTQTSTDGYFTIDNGGVLRLTAAGAAAAANDFEALPNGFAHDVVALDAAGNATTRSVTLEVTNLNDNGVVLGDADAAGDQVAENAATGTLVGITAAGVDGDTGTTVSYALGDSAGGRFQIDASSGVVSVGNGTLLDFEAGSSHSITVLATSSDGSTQTRSFTITLVDVDEVPPVVTGAATATVAENTTAVLQLAANEAVTWTMSGGADAAKFTIDASGNLAFAAAPDYEAPNDLGDTAGNNSYVVTVTATDARGNSATHTVTVTVTNADEFGIAMSDANGAANAILEGAATGTAVGVTASGVDGDANQTVTYSLADDAGGRFQIDAGTGVITVASGTLLDFETGSSHTVTVRATSSDGSTQDQAFTIDVLDRDEIAPQITGPAGVAGAATAVASVAENTTGVGQWTASEAVTWTVSGGADAAKFTIDAGGKLAFASAPDYETAADLGDTAGNNTYVVQLAATDAAGNSTVQTVTVSVTNVNESGIALVDGNAAADQVAENAANGSLVGITASGVDGDANQTVSYALTDSAGGRFAINTATGVITVADGSLLDFETSSSHAVTVRATSSDGSTQDLTLTIALTDVDEVAPAITGPSGGAGAAASSTSIVENTTAVAQLTANEAVTWAITGGADAAKFAIDASGNLAFLAAPNYEAPNDVGDTAANNTYVVVVSATDTLGNASTQTVTVAVTNANEFGIVLNDGNGAANQVAENAANGSVVGVTAVGVDGDANQTVTYALTDSAGGRFQIDAGIGVITVANGGLLDFEANSSHTVTVEATSSDGSTQAQTFTISLTDVDEVAPQITGPSGAAGAAASSTSIVENSTAVTQLTANEAVTWALTGGADAAQFTIDAAGNLAFLAAPNYEAPNDLGDTAANNTYVVVVSATDTLGNASTQTVTVTVTNANEFGIALNDGNAAANQVAENAANGSVVGVTALGIDGDANQTVTYALTDDAGGRFQIDAGTGVITVANGGLLDFEANSSHTVTVEATSSDGSTQAQTFTISLTDVDEVPPVIGGASGVTIAENTTAVTQLGANEAVTWSISGGADGARFSIDAAGNLAFVAAPDYEAPNDLGDTAGNNTYEVVVRAADALGNASTRTVTVTVANADEFGVVLNDANPAADQVAENAANGSVVGVTALGADGDANQTVSYALSDDAGGRFAIDAATGVITVANGTLLDFETGNSHTVTVQATSADGSVATRAFTIALTDVDEVPPVIGGAAAATVVENTTAATQLSADEPVTWSISGGTDAAKFGIDAGGNLAFLAAPDYEAPNDLGDTAGNNTYVVVVRAVDGLGNASTHTVTVAVANANEFPIALADANAAANQVAENAIDGSVVGITASGVDGDANQAITYSLADSAGGRFAIDASTGVVTVANGTLLDFEAGSSHAITVRATSADGSVADQVFTISLTDVDEVAPVITGPSGGAGAAASGVSIVENTSAVAQLTANEAVSWAITGGADAANFTIDAAGNLAFVSAPNYEAPNDLGDTAGNNTYVVVVSATDTLGNASTQTVTVAVTNANEFGLTLTDSNAAANQVAESAVNGSVVGVTALGVDGDANQAVSYALTDTAGGRFAIDASTGVITVADGTLLDFETSNSHTVTVQATSADGSVQAQTFTIALLDVDENAPVITGPSGAAGAPASSTSIVENTTVVAQLSADEAVTWAITGGADAAKFTIDASGNLAFVAAPDYETPSDLGDTAGNNTYVVVVSATDSGGSASTQTVTVAVTNANESGIVLSDGNPAADQVAENAANGGVVGITALGVDGDAGQAITYSLTNSAGGRFQIDAGTGEITVADGTLLDFETSTSHTVTVQASSADGSVQTRSFTIGLVDVDENLPVITGPSGGAGAPASSASIVENTSAVAQLLANEPVTWAITGGADAAKFTIDASGNLAFAAAPDYEAPGDLGDTAGNNTYVVVVSATDTLGNASTQTVTVFVTNANEAGIALSDADASANQIAENAVNGSTVGVTALGVDGDANQGIGYALSDDAGGRFAIDAATGEITVANGALLDFETSGSHTVTVQATSTDGSVRTQTFTIGVLDVDEDGPVITGPSGAPGATASATSIPENTAAVIQLTANEPVTWTLTGGLDAAKFTIDAAGNLAFAAAPDYETPDDLGDTAGNHTYVVEVSAQDGAGNTSTQSVTVTVTNVNEAGIALNDANAATNQVAENAANGSVVGITALGVDGDAGQAITYSLTGSAGGRFAINASTGVVTVANGAALDFETGSSHTITVRATSADGSVQDRSFTIALTDVDEVAPLITGPSGAAGAPASSTGIVENTTAVAQLTANEAVTWAITGGADAAKFAIDASGKLAFLAAPNYEAPSDAGDTANNNTYVVVVSATDALGNASTQTVTVAITNANEFGVVLNDADPAADQVAENAANGSVVGITALGVDGDANQAVSYALTASAGGRFAIDASTGVVTVADGTLLDFEAASSHTITVRATSADGSVQDRSFTIGLADVDENAPVIGGPAGVTIPENTTAVVQLTADEPVTWAVSGGTDAALFAIDASGNLSFLAAPDHETPNDLGDTAGNNTYVVTVTATDALGNASNRTLTVRVANVDEFGVTLADANAAANQVAENAIDGSLVGITASGVDGDANQAITYSLADSAGGRFTIDASTGVVTVANGALLDFEAGSSHAITVRATSADGSVADQVFTINLTDVDEVAPVITGPSGGAGAAASGVSIVENTTAVAQLTANEAVSWAITGGADAAKFAIDAAGNLAFVSAPNYEAPNDLGDTAGNNTYVVVVSATDTLGNASTQTVTVTVTNANEFGLTLTDSNAAANQVAESAVNGSVVGVTALGVDGDANQAVSYALTDTAGGRFAIDASTGVITVADGTLLDFETSNSHTVTVQATSADGSVQTQTFTIALLDVDENAPVITGPSGAPGAPASSTSIVENTTAVAQLSADEAVTWAITGGADAAKFTIDASGNLSFIAAPDYETPNDLGDTAGNNTYVVVVSATDTVGHASTQTVTVAISNVNDAGIVLGDGNAAADQVAENAANGSVVGVTASGMDGDANQTVSYALTDSAGGRFAINAATGVITVADGSLLDFETSSRHSVTVRATSSDGSTQDLTLTIALTDVDEVAPAITGPSGGAGAAASSTSIVENTTAVAQLTANEAVTWAITGGADAAKFAIDASGNLAFLAAPNYEAPSDLGDTAANNTYVVVVSATDTLGNASTQTVTVAVTNANESGIVLSDSNAAADQVAENAANGSVVGVTALGTDGDANQTVTYALTDDAGGRFQIDAGTGVITVANGGLLDFEAGSSHTVTVEATSSDGSTQAQTFTISLTDVDEVAPAITGPSGGAGAAAFSTSIVENSTAVAQLTANEAVTWALTGGADAAQFTIDAAGNLAFLAAPNYEAPNDLGDTAANNTYVVVVSATDTLGNASTQTVTVTVTNANEFGIALNDGNAAANQAAENAANGSVVSVTAVGIDGDANQTVTYALTDDAGGRFQIDAGTGVITVANGGLLDFEAGSSHTVTVEATSSDGSTQTQTFTISLTDVDELAPQITGPSGAPGAASSSVAILENATAVTQLAADEPVTWTISGGADGARFSIDAAGNLAFAAAPDYEAPNDLGDTAGNNTYEVVVRAADALGNANTQTLTVTVGNVGEFGLALADANATANEVAELSATGSLVGITARGVDGDANQAVSYALTGDAGGRFQIDAATGVVSVANGALLDYESASSHTITVQATSADGSVATQSFTIALTDVDENAPVITGPSGGAGAATSTASIAEGGTAVTQLSASEPVTWTVSGGADAARFTIDAGGRLAFVAAPDYEAPTDLGAGAGNNSYVVVVSATDGNGNASSQTVTVNVTDVDEIAPTITGPASVSTPENGTATIASFTASEAVSWTLSGADAARFTIVGGNLAFNPAADFELPADVGADNGYDIVVTATDAQGNSSSQAVTVHVTDVDEIAPAITGPATVSAPENTTATIAGFTANEAVSWTLSGADAARFTIVGGNLAFNPAADFELPADVGANNGYDIVVTATDAQGNSSSQAVTVNVTDVDEIAPAITGPAAASIVENSTAVIATYTAGEPVSWTLAGADAARFTIVGGNLRLAPAADFESPADAGADNVYDLLVVATDAQGNSSSQAVTVTVTDADELAPVITGPSGGAGAATSAITIDENTTAVTTLTADEPVVWTLSGADAARFSIDAAGALVFNTAPNFEAPADIGGVPGDNQYVVTVTARDAAGNLGTQAITVTVADVFEPPPPPPVISGPSGAPGAAASAAAIVENTSAVSTFTADVPVTWALSGADAARFSIDAAGNLRFVAAPDYESPQDAGGTAGDNAYEVLVTATATDGSGAASSQVVTVNVADADEVAPVITGPSGGPGAPSATRTVLENDTVVATLAASEIVTWTLSGPDAARFVIDGAGNLAFASAPDYEAPADADGDNAYVVTVTATDAAGNSSAQALTVNVADVDEIAPVIGGAAAASIAENSTATIAGYTASEGVTWSLSGADAARFTIAGGNLAFVAGADFEAPGDLGGNNVYDVVVTATDGAGNTTNRAVAITVTDVDEIAPVVTGPATASMVENSTATIAAFTASEGVTWSLSGADAARFTIAGGNLQFDPAADFEAPADAGGDNVYDVVVTATDTAGNSGSRAISVTVLDADEVAPAIAGAASASIAENSTATIASYTANEGVTWSLAGADAARFTIAGGNLRFNPAADFELPADAGGDNVYDVTVLATDAAGNMSSRAVSVTVTDRDEVAPVISGPATATVAENSGATIASFTANEGVTWTLAGADAARFTIAGGNLVLNPAADFEAPADAGGNNVYDVVVVATDAAGNASSRAVAVTVTDVDEVAPVITGPAGAAGAPASAFTVAENATGPIASFGANEPVTWTLGGADAARFTVDASGRLAFVAPPDFEAPADADGDNAYVVTLTATDAQGNASTQAVTIGVGDADEIPPAITGPSGGPGAATSATTVAENTTAVTTFSASEAVTWSLSGADAARFAIDASGQLVFVVPPDFEAPVDANVDNAYVVTVTARDSAGLATVQTLTVTVSNANDNAPVITDANASANVVIAGTATGSSTGITVRGWDADLGSTVTYTLVDDHGGCYAIDAATGAITVADGALLESHGPGTHVVTVLATSSDGSTRTANFSIQVQPDQQAAIRRLESGPLEAQPLPERDPTFGFDGRHFSLPISAFTVPERDGLVFKSLAQGEFALETDSPLQQSIHFLAAAFRDILTQPGENAFQIAVRAAGESSLRLFRGIPDQEFLQTRDVLVQVPVDAFIHSDSEAVVFLTARMADGSPLPRWLRFDPSTGKFSGHAPAGTPAELTVLVEARDREGRHAEAVFRIRLEQPAQGRAGLSEQLRSAERETVDALRGLQALAARWLGAGPR